MPVEVHSPCSRERERFSPATVPVVTQGVSLPPSASATQPSAGIAYLGHGADKLHLGLRVDWAEAWRSLGTYLMAKKVLAQNTAGVPGNWQGAGPFLVLPKGLGRRHSLHLKHEVGDVFISNTPAPSTFPNVMCWVDNRVLLKLGVVGATAAVKNMVSALGGCITDVLPSRVDLFADFHVPGGFTFDFLQSRRVGRKQKVRPVLDGDALETFGLGDAGANITARIYDKAKELLRHSEQQWTREIWKDRPASDVWRVEFQLLRPALHDWGIESVEDIVAKAGALWSYLTGKWLTFRAHDNTHKSRRSIEPWWAAVQGVAQRFGPGLTMRRRIKGASVPSKDAYVRLIAGCLPGYAARLGRDDLHSAVNALVRDLLTFYTQAHFHSKYTAKRLALGIPEKPKDVGSAA